MIAILHLAALLILFPFFSISEVEDFGIRDVHKVILSICEFRDNRHRDATIHLEGGGGRSVNEFIFVFWLVLQDFGEILRKTVEAG